ncbi:MAG: transposase [Bacteroidota bacterium]
MSAYNRQIRKITKSKGVMPNDTALLKLVYLVTQNIMVKWTAPIQKWALVIQQLAIHFEGRIDLQLNLGNEE